MRPAAIFHNGAAGRNEITRWRGGLIDAALVIHQIFSRSDLTINHQQGSVECHTSKASQTRLARNVGPELDARLYAGLGSCIHVCIIVVDIVHLVHLVLSMMFWKGPKGMVSLQK